MLMCAIIILILGTEEIVGGSSDGYGISTNLKENNLHIKYSDFRF